MRTLLRRTIEAVSTAGFTHFARRLNHRRVAILSYHNVVDPRESGRGDSSLHLPLPAFIDQIERLRRTHAIVPLGSLPSAPADRPRAVITFDDAYRGAVTRALPELTTRGIPATVFVAPALLGSEGTWWDVLSEAGLLTSTTRMQALLELQGKSDRVLQAKLIAEAPPPVPRDYGIATLEELLEYAAPGITLASHAWAHEHLPSLSSQELTRSLGDSLSWTKDLGDRSCGWLALPYGCGSPELGRRAVALGYEGVLRITGGMWKPSRERSFVPRLNIPAGLSIRGFDMRTSGLSALIR